MHISMEIIALIISVSSFLLSVYTIVSAKIKAVEKYDIDIRGKSK